MTASIELRETLLGTIAYTVVTFPIAVLWHVVLFGEQYNAFGYFDGEPSFVIGFLTIVIQGVVLSALYPKVQLAGSAIVRGIKYAMILGVFFWTAHVLAFIAKQQIAGIARFAAMETIYLLVQFGVYGVLIGLIYKQRLNAVA